MIGPDALKWGLVLFFGGLVGMLVAVIDKPTNRERYMDAYQRAERQRGRRNWLVASVIFTFLGGYTLVAIATIRFQEWRDRRAAPPSSVAAAQPPEPDDAPTAAADDQPKHPPAPSATLAAAPIEKPTPLPEAVPTPAATPPEGWTHGPVKLGAGELFMSAVVLSDGSVLALTSAGSVERRGSWLFRLDGHGRAVPSFGEGGALALEGFARGAREVAYDEAHQRIWLASIVQADVEEQVTVFRLSATGAQEAVTKLVVPRLGAPPHGSSSGNVALSLDGEGRLIVVGRADSPWTTSAQLATFRIGEQGLDASYGGLLAKLPARSELQRDLSLVRGPGGEVYVSACDGYRTWLMRLDGSGHLERFFGNAGTVELDRPGSSLAIATPSGIVVGGLQMGHFMMRRVGYDGTVDEDYAKALRQKPMKLRPDELTHLDGLAYASGNLWAAFDSFERLSGRSVTAVARYADSGEAMGPPAFLDEVLPRQSRVAARGLFPFGSRGLLLPVEAGPAHAAGAFPQVRSDVYLRPLSTAAFSDLGYLAQYEPPLPDASAPTLPAAPPAPAAADANLEEESATFYRYTDQGVVHVVSGLDKVPPALRKAAQPIR